MPFLQQMERQRSRAESGVRQGGELIPGEDYAVKEGIPGVWWPYPDVPSTQSFHHTWVLCRRRRPNAPAFAGAPVPRHRAGETKRAAMIAMTYFHPWTVRRESETIDEGMVKYAGNLRPEGGNIAGISDRVARWRYPMC